MKLSLSRDHIKLLSKELSWVLIGQILAMCGSLILLRLLTESLEPAEYGRFALALTLVGLINCLVMGGIVNGIGRFYPIADDKNDVHSYLYASFKLMSYTGSVALIAGLVAILVLLWLDYAQWLSFLIVVIALAITGGYNSFFNSIYNAARKRNLFAAHIALDPFIKVLLVIGLMQWFDISAILVIICYVVSSLLILISQFFFLHRKYNVKTIFSIVSPKQDWVKMIFIFSWPIMIWGVFGWAQNSAARWALQVYGSIDDVGYYSVLSQIGYVPIQTLMGVFMTFLNPIIYGMAGDAQNISRREKVNSLTNRISLLGIIITAILTLFSFFFHYQIMNIFVAKEYLIISGYLPIMIASGGIFGIALVIAAKHLSFLSAKQIMPASIGSAIIGVIAAFTGVYFYSFVGVVYAGLVHSVSYLILLLIVKKTWEIKNETH
jgi:O-antigen/teichoic acid export membrane protein